MIPKKDAHAELHDINTEKNKRMDKIKIKIKIKEYGSQKPEKARS